MHLKFPNILGLNSLLQSSLTQLPECLLSLRTNAQPLHYVLLSLVLNVQPAGEHPRGQGKHDFLAATLTVIDGQVPWM